MQPFQLRNNHHRAVTKEIQPQQEQQQHTSFSFGSSSSTSNIINTKDSSGGDDTNTKFKDLSKSVDEGVLSAKVPYNYKDHPLPLASPLRRLMNQEDSPTDSSNGDVDPPIAIDVQRKLQTIGTGSCGGFDSCNGVTASSIIGDNSCTDSFSCYGLDGTYNDNHTRVYTCLLYYKCQLN